MIWPKTNITINEELHTAIAPIIISASRATDIPAFYAKQFIHQLQKGYLYWTNPFNNKKNLVSLKNVKLIVFWSKNPAPLLPHLSKISDLGIDYYFNFTLNNYETEGFEGNLPSLDTRINTFIRLSEKIGKEKLIWRFDPVVLVKNQPLDFMIDKIEAIANRLNDHTNKLVFSFVDTNYKKVKNKLRKADIQLTDFTRNTKHLFAKRLTEKLGHLNLEIAGCAEPEDLLHFNIHPNKCIDNKLIMNHFTHNKELIKFIENLQTKNKLKDKGQREYCECIVSKDIGRYNTCGFSCVYCYAMQTSTPKITSNIFG